MFKFLKIKIVFFASLVSCFILFMIVGTINVLLYNQAVQEMNQVIVEIENNRGKFPENDDFGINGNQFIRYRFFTAEVDKDNNEITNINTINMEEVNPSDVLNISNIILKEKKSLNHLEYNEKSFYYDRYELNDNTFLIIVLDSEARFYEIKLFRESSLQVAIIASGLIIVLLMLISDFIVKPFQENYEFQKRFITNASHELKTPLAIISGNNEMREITFGEDEWTKSSSEEILKLTNLINRLVEMNKQEELDNIIKEKINLSEVIISICKKFEIANTNSSIDFYPDVEKKVYLFTNKNMIEEVINILLDNAEKYTNEPGTIEVLLRKKKSKIEIEVSNPYRKPENININNFFDRFYRGEESHNSSIPGSGIGLSMAKSFVNKLNGNISIEYKKNRLFFKIVLKNK